jgi:hypothetical protein
VEVKRGDVIDPTWVGFASQNGRACGVIVDWLSGEIRVGDDVMEDYDDSFDQEAELVTIGCGLAVDDTLLVTVNGVPLGTSLLVKVYVSVGC